MRHELRRTRWFAALLWSIVCGAHAQPAAPPEAPVGRPAGTPGAAPPVVFDQSMENRGGYIPPPADSPPRPKASANKKAAELEKGSSDQAKLKRSPASAASGASAASR